MRREAALKLGDLSSFPGFATESLIGPEKIFIYVHVCIYMYVDADVCLCVHTQNVKTMRAKFEHFSLEC